MKILLIHLLLLLYVGLLNCFDANVVTPIDEWLENDKACVGDDYDYVTEEEYYDDYEETISKTTYWPTRADPPHARGKMLFISVPLFSHSNCSTLILCSIKYLSGL